MGPKIKLITLISLLVGWVAFNFWRASQLRKTNIVTHGTITGTRWAGRNNPGRFSLYGTFYTKNKAYEVTSLYNDKDFKDSVITNYFIGKEFPVVYAPGDPGYSDFLIIPKDFELYNYPFPDSLKWVMKYTRDK